MTELTYKDQYQEVSIGIKKEDITFDEFMEIVKAVAGAVYCEQLWDEYMDNDGMRVAE